MSILSLVDYKTYTGSTSVGSDDVLNQLLTATVGAVGDYCNRDFVLSTRVEYRDGNDTSRMMLANYPIVSVASVTIDGRDVPRSVGGGVGYDFTTGGRIVWMKGYSFTRGIRNVVITLNAGYDATTMPAELKSAMYAYTLARHKERDRIGVGSKSLAGESVTFDAGSGTSGRSEGIPAAAKSVFSNYLNTIPESGL